MLNHPIELTSTVGKGSRFTVASTLVLPRQIIPAQPPTEIVPDHSRDRLVVVIDDDPLATDAMAGLLRSWGCRVITGNSRALAMNELVKKDPWP